MPKKPRRAISYIRFSSKRQATGRSKRRQIEQTERFCHRHNLQLDASLSYEDLGRSSFRGQNRDIGALGRFLKAAKGGEVPAGTVLVVESLDRLSRQAARRALRLIEDIIETGVTVATITPERFYDEAALDDPFQLLEMLFISIRANEESARKSERVADVWNKRREQARADGKPVTSRCPAWLELRDGKIRVVRKKAAVVRRIIQWCADGHGAPSILKMLHDQKIANPASGEPNWSLVYVQNLMKDRRAIGEYQPRRLVDGKPQPVGTPIEDYYPVVVPIDLFNRAQHEIGRRRRHNITTKGDHVNLLAGLVFDPITNSKYIVDKVEKGKGRRLCPLARRNKQARALSIEYDRVEAAVLAWVEGLRLGDLVQSPQPCNALRAELDDLDRRITTYQTRLEDDPDFEELLDPLKKATVHRDRILAELQDISNVSASVEHTTKDAHSVLEEIKTANGKKRKELRLRMRAHLANIIDRIELVGVGYWRWSVGILDIALKNGTTRREVTHRDILPANIYSALLTTNLRMTDAQRETVDTEVGRLTTRGFDARIIQGIDDDVRIVLLPDDPVAFAERVAALSTS